MADEWIAISSLLLLFPIRRLWCASFAHYQRLATPIFRHLSSICEANSVDKNVSEFNHQGVSAKPTPPSQLPDPSNLRDVLAYWIRLKRVDRGWSQERLALECELDRTYVSAVERSRWNVSLSNIERFAQALNVEAWTLLKPPPSASGINASETRP